MPIHFLRSVGHGFGEPGQMFKEDDDQRQKQINETEKYA